MGGWLTACGGGTEAPDARIPNMFDADNGNPPDAPGPDAPGPDAPMAPSPGGTISVQEIFLANTTGIPGTPFQGLQVSISFSTPTKAPSFGTGQIGECTVVEYNIGTDQLPVPTDQGVVNITVGGTAPAIPPCAFVGGSYRCIGGMGAGVTGDLLVKDPAGAGSNTGGIAHVAGTPAFSMADIGRWISVTGAATAGNNGNFPVVGYSAGPPETIVYANPNAADESADGVGYTLIAGVGPIPSNPDPGLVADDATVTVELVPGTGATFEAFTTPALNFGDDFDLDAASLAAISAVPTTSPAADYTLACDTAGGSCGTGSALGSILLIETTDADLTGLGPFDFPEAQTKSVNVTCSAIGATSITVPAAAMEFVANSGATRIRTTFLRDAFSPQQNQDGTHKTNVVAGHGIIGYTTP